jgi:uncharacterized protein
MSDRPEDPKIIEDQLGYGAMMQEAFRGVVRAALSKVAKDGLPGEHHFYISFVTQAPGVTIHPDLLARFPEDMTIVIQNQYTNLEVTDKDFSIGLSFSGVPRRLTIPFSAIHGFTDPHAQFQLEFDISAYEDEPEEVTSTKVDPIPDTDEADSEAPKVISLDQFRKK